MLREGLNHKRFKYNTIITELHSHLRESESDLQSTAHESESLKLNLHELEYEISHIKLMISQKEAEKSPVNDFQEKSTFVQPKLKKKKTIRN